MTEYFGGGRVSRWTAALFAAAAAALLAVQPARAETLAEVLPDLIKLSKKTKAAEADVSVAREKAREALGDWFPKLDLTGSYGYQNQLKGNRTADTSVPPRALDAKITQLLWDFGSTNLAVDNARLSFVQAQAARDATEQSLILEGVVAYLDLMRRTRLLEFSRGSEDNIKRQTELEDARVQRGSGFSTDVLQSKRQLASAQAARARAEGALQVARNRYLNVFDKLMERPATMAMPRLPLDLLPPTLNEVVDISGKENPQLMAAKMSTDVARNTVAKTFSDKFAPTINLVGEHNHKNDFDGTLGQKHDRLIKVEGKYSFNLGFTAINTLRASEFNLTSTEHKYGQTLDNVQEQARNSWQELETSRQNLEHLRNEANIAAEFLELARKERALGRRSLIDVLSGETALINASSDATSAETDMAISVFKLLSSMGRLNIETVAPAPKPRSETESAPALDIAASESSRQIIHAALPAAPEKAETPPAAASESSRQTIDAAPPAAPEKAEPAPAAASESSRQTIVAAPVLETVAPAPVAAKPVPQVPPAPPVPSAWANPDRAVPAAASITPAALDTPATATQDGPVLYLVEKASLRSDTSMIAPAVRVLQRCEAVRYVQGKDEWFRVRTLASGGRSAAEGWIYGQLVSNNKSGCEEKRAELR